MIKPEDDAATASAFLLAFGKFTIWHRKAA
jgi:hypothetical protein